jgi:hypothetical protein
MDTALSLGIDRGVNGTEITEMRTTRRDPIFKRRALCAFTWQSFGDSKAQAMGAGRSFFVVPIGLFILAPIGYGNQVRSKGNRPHQRP